MGRFSLADPAVVADADLAERAAAGDNRAFEELYRRHAPAAWRVAQAVTNHKDDAADAVSEAFAGVLQALPAGRLRDGGSFRAYLLSATRRASIDQLRRRQRQQPGDMAGLAERPATAVSGSPIERLLVATDSALVASAFRGLPERWRSVLWLTEVEQIPAKEAAPILGMSANGVAQLAVRARNGLRERYIQAHLSTTTVPRECRFTVERLGAYVAGALSPRDLAKVDQHLAGCETCRARNAELEELGERLRRIVLPFPLGLGALALKHWRVVAGHSLLGKVRASASLAARAERPLAVMSAALFAAGLAGVGVVGGSQPGPSLAGPAPMAAPPGPQMGTRPAVPPHVFFDTASSHAGSLGFDLTGAGTGTPSGGRAEDLSGERRRQAVAIDGPVFDGRESSRTDDVVVAPGPSPEPPPPPPPGPPTAVPLAQVQVTVSGGAATAAVAAGGGPSSCTGVTVADHGVGCAPPPPNSDRLLTATTGGSSLPAQDVRLP
ncbi:MAG: hypothetical protein QOK43_1538 [Acidimicrobiaceae bacterium]|nr:hypothetical protein [Acidimicrobiaceae bacterium]